MQKNADFIVEAGLENSGVVDSETGRAVLVSTTARVYFRKAFPAYRKVRNQIMNQYIAQMFSNARITDYFRPKNQKGDGDVGEVREVGGGKFVGIIANDHVRVIAVKGSMSGALPAMPVEMGQGPDKKPEEQQQPGTSQVEEALKGGT